TQDDGDGWDQWEPAEGGFLAGTPPCSGFSVLSLGPGWERGPGSPINSCMHELVQYASRCTGLDGGRGVEVVSLESVQGAFKKGRGLMQELRDKLVAGTGQRYDIH